MESPVKELRWRPSSERLWSIAGYGFALVLAADAAFKEDQAALAVVEAILGIGILLVTYVLSGLRVPYPSLETTLRIMLWNIVLAVACGIGFFFVGPVVGGTIGFGLPFLLGLWLVILAARFAIHRAVVLAVATLAGILFVLQAAFYVFLLVGAKGESPLPFGVHLAVVAVAGPALLAWLILAKRRRWNGEAAAREHLPKGTP